MGDTFAIEKLNYLSSSSETTNENRDNLWSTDASKDQSIIVNNNDSFI